MQAVRNLVLLELHRLNVHMLVTLHLSVLLLFRQLTIHPRMALRLLHGDLILFG